MRFVIVCLIKGNALQFHEKAVSDICSRFNVKRQKLSAHFTLKAPFETESEEGAKEIENKISEFIKNKTKQKIEINGLDHFRSDVIFMKIIPSKEALLIYNEFTEMLKKIKWLTWKRHDGNQKTFHCTIVTHLTENNFTNIWNYAKIKYDPHFSAYFDNISLLKWESKYNRWITYKEFRF